jgi:uncharacterized membrane protein YraQ (UPF0718 family)
MNGMRRKWHKGPEWARSIVYIIFGLIVAVFLGFVLGFVIQQLWNWLMPGIFNLKEITYWQAVGIFILARIILGSFSSNVSQDGANEKKKRIACEEEKADIRKEWGSWKYYDEWWDQEGKKAFESYVSEKQEESGNEGE